MSLIKLSKSLVVAATMFFSDDTRLASYYYLDGEVMRFASKPRQGYYWAPGASIDAPKIHEATYQFCLSALKKTETKTL